MAAGGQVLDEAELLEFKNEATELMDESESRLLSLEGGGDFHSNYDAIFRVFHSLKGAAGMLGLTELQSHMHQVETHFQSTKAIGSMTKPQISYFLKGVDAARLLLDGKPAPFVYDFSAGEDVKIPTAPAAPPQPASTPTKNVIGRAVIVDDEESIGEILTEVLRDAGFETIFFTNPKTMLAEFQKFKPDIVLSDLKMPEMSGMDVLRGVHAVNPEIPVILISGHISKDEVIHSIENGVYSVIEKPFSNAHVISVARSATKRFHIANLLNRSINFVLYQFSDLDDFLKQTGKEDVRITLQKELQNLMEARRLLRVLAQTPAGKKG